MPIFIKEKIERVSQKDFNVIDEVMMKLIFELHNDIGRFCDEKIYHQELSYKAKNMGFDAQNEVEICVKHKDFLKKYYLDLLINHSVIYELKTVDNFSGMHHKQLINYLLITNLAHGKLINFRTPSVEDEFVSTTLDVEYRMDYKPNFQNFLTINKSNLLVELIDDLVSDWGTFLDIDLYREALIFFLGGKDKVISPMDILKEDRIIGQQKICLLDDRTAFHLSTLTKHSNSYEINIRRLLNHTRLEAIQWINFNKTNITFKTIK